MEKKIGNKNNISCSKKEEDIPQKKELVTEKTGNKWNEILEKLLSQESFLYWLKK